MNKLSLSLQTFRKNLKELVSEGVDAHGLVVVFKKELADHFNSYRFVILFALIAMVSLISTYMTGVGVGEDGGYQRVAQFVVWPYITSLIAITLVCFGFSYAVFMRQEIRSV